jgi:hypothetical protein
MATQEQKLNTNDSAFLKVLPDAIEDDAHQDHHPISTENYLPRMATQEPKLNNNDSAFLKVLPDAIEDDAHQDHHPISTNTIPSSESTRSLSSSKPTSSKPTSSKPMTSKPTQYCFPYRSTLKAAVNSYISEKCATNTTCTTRNQYGEIGTWCVKHVKDMRTMFYGLSSFNSDISR